MDTLKNIIKLIVFIIFITILILIFLYGKDKSHNVNRENFCSVCKSDNMFKKLNNQQNNERAGQPNNKDNENMCQGQCIAEYKGKMNMPVRHTFLIEDAKGNQYVTDYFKFKNWNQANLKAFIIDNIFYISNENSDTPIETETINVIRNKSGPWQVTVDNEHLKWNLMKFAGVFDFKMDWVDLVGWDFYEYKIRMIQ